MTFKTAYDDQPFVAPTLSPAQGMSISGETVTTVSTPVEITPVVVPKTWDDIRKDRDALIAACDWCMLPDAPISESLKAEMVVYRQELRDITKAFESPDRVMWPFSPLDRAAMLKKYSITFGERTSPPGFGWADANATTQANTASDANTTTTTQ